MSFLALSFGLDEILAQFIDLLPDARIGGCNGGLRFANPPNRQPAGDLIPFEQIYAVFSNSSRPISMRRISLVPAPIS